MEDSIISNLLEDQRNEDIEIKVLLKQEEPEQEEPELSPPQSHRISRSKTRRVMQDLEIYKEKIKKLKERKTFIQMQPKMSKMFIKSALSIIKDKYSNQTLRQDHLNVINKIIIFINQ